MGYSSAGPGLTRRSLIKRSAIVGGSLAWATPVVQSFGPSAFAQDGSPIEQDGDCHEISNLQVVFTCDGTTFGFFKFEDTGAGTCQLEEDPGLNFPHMCVDTSSVDVVIDSETELAQFATVDCSDDCVWTVCFEDGCTLIDGAVFGANVCQDLTLNPQTGCYEGGPIPL